MKLQAGLLIAVLLLVASPADAATLPKDVREALRLQTTGDLAVPAFVEPCTSAGIRDAIQRNDDAISNADWTSAMSDQRKYANGFARCALSARDLDEATVFGGACLQAGVASLVARVRLAGSDDVVHAKARQFRIIATWLADARSASDTERTIASNSIAILKHIDPQRSRRPI